MGMGEVRDSELWSLSSTRLRQESSASLSLTKRELDSEQSIEIPEDDYRHAEVARQYDQLRNTHNKLKLEVQARQPSHLQQSSGRSESESPPESPPRPREGN